jgi:hypothetical protein
MHGCWRVSLPSIVACRQSRYFAFWQVLLGSALPRSHVLRCTMLTCAVLCRAVPLQCLAQRRKGCAPTTTACPS